MMRHDGFFVIFYSLLINPAIMYYEICSIGFPDPREEVAANLLDVRIYGQRVQQLDSIRVEASGLRQTCTDAQVAVTALEDYLERLKEMAYEVQY